VDLLIKKEWSEEDLKNPALSTALLNLANHALETISPPYMALLRRHRRKTSTGVEKPGGRESEEVLTRKSLGFRTYLIE